MTSKGWRTRGRDEKIMTAINVFNMQEVLLLIGTGKGLVNTTAANGETALTKAAASGDAEGGKVDLDKLF